MARPLNTGGDDLDDDYVPDDLVALSDAEELSESDLKLDAVRPAHDLAEEPVQAQEPVSQPSAAQLKKRKRRQKEKERRLKRLKLQEAVVSQEPQSLAPPSPTELSELLRTWQTKVYPNLTSMELDDMRIPESCIADTTSWTASRTLENLEAFITSTLPSLHSRLAQKSKSAGAPTLLFVAGAALRVAEVARTLKNSKLRGEKGGEVAKLFARHFKLEEHVAYLQRTKIGAAVGTPGRIGKLLCTTDALSVMALSHIMLDISYQDEKKRSMFDIPETRDEVFKTVLGAEKIRDGLTRGKIQLVFY